VGVRDDVDPFRLDVVEDRPVGTPAPDDPGGGDAGVLRAVDDLPTTSRPRRSRVSSTISALSTISPASSMI